MAYKKEVLFNQDAYHFIPKKSDFTYIVIKPCPTRVHTTIFKPHIFLEVGIKRKIQFISINPTSLTFLQVST